MAELSLLKHRLHNLATGDGLKARLVRGGVGSAGIQAANRLLALALGIVLARMLGPSGYGIYAYAFAIMSLLMVVAEAGVPTLLMREVAASQGRAEWGLLRGALRRGAQFVALAATSVSLLGLLVLWWFAGSLRPEVLYTTTMMLLVLPVAALCKAIAHAMRGLHRVVVGQAVDMLIRPLLVLIIVAVVFVAWPEYRQPYIAMAAQLLGALVVLFIGVLVLRRLLPDKSRTTAPEYNSRQWLKSALPFTLIGGAGIINNQADIIMLGWFMESEDVGVYRVVSQGAILLTFPLQAGSAVLGPWFARCYATEDWGRMKNLYRKSARLTVLVTIPLLLVYLVAGEQVLGLIFGPRYAIGASALIFLSIGYFANVSFGPIGILLQMANEENVTAYFLWAASFFNIATNLALIPMYGINGAACATAVTVFTYHASLWLYYKRVFRDRKDLIQ